MARKGLFDKLLSRFRGTSKHPPRPYHRPYQEPTKFHTLEEKLEILREFDQSGAPLSIFAKWKGISVTTLTIWFNIRKTKGEAGLIPKTRKLEKNLPPETIQKIIQLKKDNPQWGGAKIADYLARHDFIKISHSGILNILKDNSETKDLIAEYAGPKNPREFQPKSFERSKPRQMYQMDITNWHLKGLYNIYIIGCIDDYSRYIVSWGLFRRQTSEHCIDVLRNAIEQHSSTPEEVLTDNGRQFYSWRGKNDFQRFLLKMGIKHIRSRPYHPQTLGKIESFWRNMYQELLSRETITSFEDMQEKVKAWIDMYNFKRPHQGIGGLVPADRFFGVDKQVKEAMLEGAGMVKDALMIDPYRLSRPMYLIGRIGDKEIRVLAKDGSVIVQGIESMERKDLQPDTPDVISEPKGDNNNDQSILSRDSTAGEGRGSQGGLEQDQDSQTNLPGTPGQQADLLPVGKEDSGADNQGSGDTKTGPASQGLCSPGESPTGDSPVEGAEPDAPEGEQETPAEQ
jgi:transposase InsO family protein